MRMLLDECLPRKLKYSLDGYIEDARITGMAG